MRANPQHFDAFISYSHAQDRLMAEALQSELQRFARPWYRPRALRVFRDTTSLAATPELWPSIERALAASEWFILMASPQSAGSRWVAREIDWWKANRKPEKMLVALVSGSIVWGGRDFDWPKTNALPRNLSGAFSHEPLWVDLRALPRSGPTPETRPRLGDLVSAFAAPIRGMDKDAMVGEHVVQQRRTRRIVRATIAALSVLLLAVSVATVFAVRQRNEAITQSRIATARQLAATAVGLESSRMDLAQLFAVEAHRMHDDQQTRAALFGAVTASPALVRYLPAGSPVLTLAGSSDGQVVVAGTSTGRVLRWSVAGGPPTTVAELGGPVFGVAASADGSTIVADGRSSVVRWTAADGTRPLGISTETNGAVALSPSGRFVMLAGSPRAASKDGHATQITVLDTRNGRKTRRDLEFAPARIEFRSDAELVALSEDGRWDRMTVPTLTSTVHSADSLMGVHGFEPTLSVGGDWFTFTNSGGDLPVWSTGQVSDQDRPDLEALSHGSEEQALAVSADGTRTASADAGTIYVSQTGPASDTVPSAAQVALSGGGAVPSDGLRFLGDNAHLVSITGNALVLWDINQLTRVGTGARADVPIACSGCTAPKISVAPDGRRVAIAGNDGYALTVVKTATGESTTVPADLDTGTFRLAGWSADGQSVYVQRRKAIEMRAADDPSRVQRTILLSTDAGVLSVSPDGKQFVAETGNQLQMYDAGSARATRTLAKIPSDVSVEASVISSDQRTVAYRALVGERTGVFVVAGGRTQAIPGASVNDMALSGSDLVVQREDAKLELWKIGADSPYQTIAQDASFMPAGNRTQAHPAVGGSMVAQRRSDGNIIITDIGSGQQVGSLELPAGSAISKTSFAFLPGAKDLISVTEGGSDGLFIRWNLSPDAWAATACQTAARDLSDAEWRTYAGTVARPGAVCDAGSIMAAPKQLAALQKKAAAGPQPTLATDVEGREPVYVLGTDPAHHTLTFDLIVVLAGEAAIKAQAPQNPGVPVELLDKYVIVNNNRRLRTLRIADPVTITTLDPRQDPKPPVQVPVAALINFLAAHPYAADGRLSTAPYWLVVKHGQVVSMEQVPNE
ncbi:TIR domain-containing protein [Actinoplanes sp. NPDC051475]|uniref:toll/interleukin-1 receptor domain-containing protein n=1 Tax=Actinoplanes sp. NPDC051475 TaxID=3157225 RepID=UPI00344D1127